MSVSGSRCHALAYPRARAMARASESRGGRRTESGRVRGGGGQCTTGTSGRGFVVSGIQICLRLCNGHPPLTSFIRLGLCCWEAPLTALPNALATAAEAILLTAGSKAPQHLSEPRAADPQALHGSDRGAAQRLPSGIRVSLGETELCSQVTGGLA